MNLNRVFTIFLRQFFLIKRSLHRLISIFYWSLLEIFLWGFLTVYLNRLGEDRLSFMTVVIGTVILWNFLNRIQQGVAISFLEDVWARNFINLFASPLNVREYVGGLVLVSIVSATLSIAVMTLAAWLLFTYNLFQFGLLMIPFIAVLFFFGLALGFYTTAMILRFGPSSEILAWSIPALLMPFSGILYPIATLPSWLHPIANIIPSSHVFEGMRAIVILGTFDWERLLFAVLLSLVFLLTSYWLLLRTYRHVLREGKLTRFQTE